MVEEGYDIRKGSELLIIGQPARGVSKGVISDRRVK